MARAFRLHRRTWLWWAPWRKRCRCGIPWWPCPDSRHTGGPLGGAPMPGYRNDGHHGQAPAWNSPTVVLPNSSAYRAAPLLTRGQNDRAARKRQTTRRDRS